MTTSQLQTLYSELFGALQVIAEDEELTKKAVQLLKRLASEKLTN